MIPDIAGLRLNFILEPAYYLGVVDFQGLAKYFSFTRLLQVVDMPEEYPYVKGRMPVAEAQLLQFLERNGYFQAQVHSESQIDDAEQLVHVTFVVRIGKQARIGKVGFEGPADPEQARLLQRVRSLRARFSGGLLLRFGGIPRVRGQVQMFEDLGIGKSQLQRQRGVSVRIA